VHAQNSLKLLRAVGLAATALFALALGWLCWQAWFEPGIVFFPPGTAPWIVYPSPPRVHTFAVQSLPAVFRRQFVLERQPAKALLDWRSFAAGRLSVNGQRAALPAAANWKNGARIDISQQLHAGTNELTAIVWADSGPPALSLRLETDEVVMVSDEQWRVSLAGAIEQPAALAAKPVAPQPGNPFFGGDRTGPALRQTAGWQCFFFVAALTAALLWRHFRGRLEDGGQKEKWLRICAVAALAAALIVLRGHNVFRLTLLFGFDSSAHLDYVKYIQETGSLPLANQGLEMFQAPLYYAIAAALLKVMHHAASDLAGLRLLQIFNLLVGAADIALVWLGLGLLYPRQWKKQLAGAALAAYAPWHLYLLHYPTNETLCCMLGTAALCLCLKCVAGASGPPGARVIAAAAPSAAKLPEKAKKAPRPPGRGAAVARRTLVVPKPVETGPKPVKKSEWPVGWLAALGIALGAACLAKSSSLALLPLVFAALAVELMARREQSPMTWVKVIGWVFGLALGISAWHYWRAWRHFGTPFLGGWSRESAPIAWWQPPGYATAEYFTRFGHVLIAPYFCGFHGFCNAMYSTLWGDGGRGGVGRIWLGTPWNDDFMTAGYIWALAPSLLVLSGVAATLARFRKNPRLDWLLLTAVAAAYFLALLQLNLKLPYLACGKATFALTALLPFCAFAVAGWDWWTERFGSWAALVLAALLGVWLLNDYAAFWVRPEAPRTRLLAARQKFIDGTEDASADFASLVEADAHNSLAAEYLARAELKAGRTNRFEEVVREAITNNAVNGEMAELAAKRLVQLGHLAAALESAKSAAHSSPDDELIAETWLTLARASKQDREVVAAAAWFLRNDPDSLSTHKMMAEALNHLGQKEAAAMQLAIGQAAAF
jgi:tetratricopeptide (TPR) repeat protein